MSRWHPWSPQEPPRVRMPLSKQQVRMINDQPTFQIGEQVFWEAGRACTLRFGTILAVIGSRRDPRIELGSERWTALVRTCRLEFDAASMEREGWSYLVEVNTKQARGKRRIFWPRTSALRPVEDL